MVFFKAALVLLKDVEVTALAIQVLYSPTKAVQFRQPQCRLHSASLPWPRFQPKYDLITARGEIAKAANKSSTSPKPSEIPLASFVYPLATMGEHQAAQLHATKPLSHQARAAVLMHDTQTAAGSDSVPKGLQQSWQSQGLHAPLSDPSPGSAGKLA